MCVGDIFSLYQIYDLVFSLYSLHPKEIYQQGNRSSQFYRWSLDSELTNGRWEGRVANIVLSFTANWLVVYYNSVSSNQAQQGLKI